MAERAPAKTSSSEHLSSSPRKRGSSDFQRDQAKTLDPGLRRDDEQKRKQARKQTLHGHIHVKHGYPFKSEHFTDSGKFIVLTPGNFREAGGFKQQTGKEKFYDAEFPPEYLHKRGDLIVAMTEQAAGLLGSMAFVPESDRYLHNQRVGKVTAKSDDVHLGFLYYAFQLQSVRTQLRNTASGSKVRHTSPERIYDVSIPLPPVTDQQKIAAVLSALDAKIDLNQRINAELEALAKTIYDYWFVQFDFPDALGRPYKSSGGAMVWNDTLKREIPAGWRNVPLRNFVDCNTSSYGASNLPEQIIYLDTGNLTNNRLLASQGYDTGKDEVPSRARRIASNGDVLYSTVRPNQNHHGIIKASVKGLVVSTGFAVLTCTDPHLNGDFIYMVVRGNDVASKMQRIAESSRSSYPSIAPDDLLDLQFALPADRTQISKVCKFFDQVFLKVWANEKESRELTRLRDWLLPLLMNGQVRVA